MLTTAFVPVGARQANLGLPFRNLIRDAVAIDDDRIKTAFTANAGTKVTHTATNFAANVDKDRNVTLRLISTAGGAIVHVRAVVTGLAPDGSLQTEVLKRKTVGTATGVKMFRAGSISKIETLCVGVPGSSGSVSVGVGNSLYLGTDVAADADVTLVTVDGTADTVTIDEVHSSFLPTTTPNAARDYEVFGKSTKGLTA